jgi:hypothetical protein
MNNATKAIPALARHSSLAALEATIIAARSGEGGDDARRARVEIQALALQAAATAGLFDRLLRELAGEAPSAAALDAASADLGRIGAGAAPLLDAARALGEQCAAMLLRNGEADAPAPRPE